MWPQAIEPALGDINRRGGDTAPHLTEVPAQLECDTQQPHLQTFSWLVRECGNESAVVDLVLYGLFSFICSEQFHG